MRQIYLSAVLEQQSYLSKQSPDELSLSDIAAGFPLDTSLSTLSFYLNGNGLNSQGPRSMAIDARFPFQKSLSTTGPMVKRSSTSLFNSAEISPTTLAASHPGNASLAK
jgi:hypothetical protein